MFIYLDNSASTKPSKEVIEAVQETLCSVFGNPSALCGPGLAAERLLKAARVDLARTLSCSPSELYFTSGGTESINWVLRGVWKARKRRGGRIVSTAVEHPALINCCEGLREEGAEIVLVEPEPDGRIEASKVASAISPDTILVSVMHVNNETGAIMPLSEIRKAIDASGSGALFHTDAVQSYGKLDCDIRQLGVDFLSLSGHKVHAPKGIGALYIKSGIHIPAFILGGGQEGGMRSGTENVPGIAGFGAAARRIAERREEDLELIKKARARLLERIKSDIGDIRINSPEDACPSILSMSFMGCKGEVLLRMLDSEGICVSTGSACSAKKRDSEVLKAMGLSSFEMEGALRFSFSYENTPEEMDYVADKLRDAVERQRSLMRYPKG